jgi:phosphoglycerate kinase
MLEMTAIALSNRRVLIRVDLNVPLRSGKILDDTRIRAIIPTIEWALKAQAKIILLSHLGRPIEGEYTPALSLEPVAFHLSKLLQRPVHFKRDWLEGFLISPGEVVLCENVRFNVGEEANDLILAKKMASLCDVFVMDAFGTAHRAQASTVGIAQFAPEAVAGPLLIAELKALKQALEGAKMPVVAIVGGAKASDKLKVLKYLIPKINTLIVGGGIANTLLAAAGNSIGSSLYEPLFVEEAKILFALAKEYSVNIELPLDVTVAPELTALDKVRIVSLNEESGLLVNIEPDEKILDIGPKTSEHYASILHQAGTILWNGPLGVFETDAFEKGTESLAKAIAHSNAFSIAGGGETLAAIEKYGVQQGISYISTGGGAFLEYLEGKTLPAVAALEARGADYNQILGCLTPTSGAIPLTQKPIEK